MSYDFTPKNKAAGGYRIGAFSWPFMLEAGLGLVLGIGNGFAPGEFIYLKRKDGLCVQYNDGARVSAKEAKELAKVCRWIAAIETGRIREWEKVPESRKKEMTGGPPTNIYTLPWSEECVKKFTDFADWAEKSGGFRVF